MAVTYTDEGLARWWRTMRGTPGLPDKFALECETFPQAARAVSSGAYAAILPRAARADFDREAVVEVRGSDLEPLTHDVALVWNPRSYARAPQPTPFAASSPPPFAGE